MDIFKAMDKEAKEQRGVSDEWKDLAKVKDALLEGLVKKNNATAMKIVFYLAKSNIKLSDAFEDGEVTQITLSSSNLCEHCDISKKTLERNIEAMQKTSLKFVDDGDKITEYISLVPYAKFEAGKDKFQIKMFNKVLKLVVNVKNKYYSPVNVSNLMRLKSKHSLKMIQVLERINNYSKQAGKRKHLNLKELNLLFGVKYTRWSEFERRVLRPTQKELDHRSKLSFIYEANFERKEKGRPQFRDVTIDLVDNLP